MSEEMDYKAPQEARIHAATKAIADGWEKCRDVPFPLYGKEAESIAIGVLAALDAISPAYEDRHSLAKWLEEKIRHANMRGQIATHAVADSLAGELIEASAANSAHRDTSVTLGVGDGAGQLFVHGDYDSIKACQTKLLERDSLRSSDIPKLLSELSRVKSFLADVLKRDAQWSLSGSKTDCGCIRLSRDAEREYESGKCPHQKARAALKEGTE